MPYTTQEGRALPMDKSFTHNNVQFGANWLRVSNPDDKESYGISWTDPEPEVVVRAPLEREKSDGVKRAKNTAGQLLATTDWQVIASVERGRAVASDVSEYRAAVIVEADRLESQYSTAESYEALDAIVQNWPETPEEKAQREADEARIKKQQEEDAAKEGGGE